METGESKTVPKTAPTPTDIGTVQNLAFLVVPTPTDAHRRQNSAYKAAALPVELRQRMSEPKPLHPTLPTQVHLPESSYPAPQLKVT